MVDRRDPRSIHEWNCNVDLVNDEGKHIDRIAAANHFSVGYKAYKEAIQHYSHAIIILRMRGRIVWKAKTGAYDPKAGKVELLWEGG